MPDPTLRLPAGTVRPVPAEGITCLDGLCWATQTGDARDHVLRPGASWQPLPGRRALVWALTDTVLHVPSREPGPLATLARAILQAAVPARA